MLNIFLFRSIEDLIANLLIEANLKLWNFNRKQHDWQIQVSKKGIFFLLFSLFFQKKIRKQTQGFLIGIAHPKLKHFQSIHNQSINHQSSIINHQTNKQIEWFGQKFQKCNENNKNENIVYFFFDKTKPCHTKNERSETRKINKFTEFSIQMMMIQQKNRVHIRILSFPSPPEKKIHFFLQTWGSGSKWPNKTDRQREKQQKSKIEKIPHDNTRPPSSSFHFIHSFKKKHQVKSRTQNTYCVFVFVCV